MPTRQYALALCLLLAAACSDGERLTSAQREQLVDKLAKRQLYRERPQLDSLCQIREAAELQDLVDSLVPLKLERLRARMAQPGR